MTLDDLDTPFLIADLDIVERNIRRSQQHLDGLGLASRPHIKTHKLPFIAWKQVEAGAVGVTCQKLGEAEVMVDAGIHEVFISYNIVGRPKLERLAGLCAQARIFAAADSEHVIQGYAAMAREFGVSLGVFLEADTGGKRAGIQEPAAARPLARQILESPGLTFEGVFTYPTGPATQSFFEGVVEALQPDGIVCPRFSGGGSLCFWELDRTPICTEHRAGTNVYCDRNLVTQAGYRWEDCALEVLTTVVSRPTAGRAVLDLGTKAMTSDPNPQGGFHHIRSHPEAVFEKLSEEHGHLDVSRCASPPALEDRLRVVPNHACGATNLHDLVALHRGGRVERILPISARGKIR